MDDGLAIMKEHFLCVSRYLLSIIFCSRDSRSITSFEDIEEEND